MNADQFQQFIAANAQAIAANANANASADIKLRPFASADAVGWLAWRQHAESIAELKGWDNTPASRRRARWAIRAAMQDGAASAVSDVNAAVAPVPDTIGAFMDLYQQRFCPEAMSRLARSSFQGAGQHHSETVLEWHTRCRSLYLRAYPDRAGNVERDRTLIDQFVEGLRVAQVRVHTYDSYPQTYAAALTHASNKVASVQIEERLAGKQASDPFKVKAEADLLAIRPDYGTGRAYHSGGSNTSRGNAVQKCYFCQNPEHLKADCTLWKKAKEQLLGGGGQGQRNAGRGSGNRRGRGRGGNYNSSANSRNNRSLNNMGNPDQEQGHNQQGDSENC